jgi:ribosome-associated translation inhibitor RaiA
MELPVQITFRHMGPSEAVASRIQSEAARLDGFFPRITSCPVVVEAPHRRHRRGEWFHVRVELGVPGSEIVVRHEPSPHAALQHEEAGALKKREETHPEHKDVYVAIRDAFAGARRQLRDYARRLRGDVKMHTRAGDAAGL